VRSEIGYAAYRVALHFHVGRVHLFDQRLQATQCYDRNLVFSYNESAILLNLRVRIPHTVHCQVSQRGACGTLYFDIGVLKEEQNGLEGISVDFPNI